jgi:hypothetical protein
LVIIFKNERQNLQGIDTFSIFNIYSKIPKKRNYLPKQLYAFFITICKKNSKIHSYGKKKKIGQKNMQSFFLTIPLICFILFVFKRVKTHRGWAKIVVTLYFFKGPMFELQPCHYYERHVFAYYGRSKPK